MKYAGQQDKSNVLLSLKFFLQKLSIIETIVTFSALISLWYLVFPHPRLVLFFIIAFLPIAALVLNQKKPSDEEIPKNVTSYAILLVFMPAIVLFIRFTLIQYDSECRIIALGPFELLGSILSKGNLSQFDKNYEGIYYGLIGGVFIVYLLLFVISFREIILGNFSKNLASKPIAIFLIINILVWAISLVHGVNYLFDFSAPRIERCLVIDKHVNHGRVSSFYHITLKGDMAGEKDMEYHYEVTEAQYDAIPLGKPINKFFRDGRLGIHWTSIELPKTNRWQDINYWVLIAIVAFGSFFL